MDALKSSVPDLGALPTDAGSVSELDIPALIAQVEKLVRLGDTRRLKVVRELLKAAVDKKQAATRTERWAADPSLWVRERLNQHVWSKQAEILTSVQKNRRTAVRSCHGIGKSHVASLAVSHWLDSHPPGEAFVVTTAPTTAQVRAILWRYIRRIHKAGGLTGRVNQTEWLIDEELVAFGRKPADQDESAFQGIHARYVLVVIDEACGVPEQLWVAADALATGPDCRILAIGNPDNAQSHFFTVNQPDSGWNVIKISAFDSPNFTGEPVSEAVAASLVSKIWVHEKKTDWGVDNPLYMSKVLGEFSVDAENSIVRASDVAACRIDPETRYSSSDLTPVELGVDVGGGSDETVIRERRGIRAGREWKIRSDRPEKIAPLVIKAIRDTGATMVKVDSIGVGFGVIGELRNAANRHEHKAKIVGVNAANRSSEPKIYMNLRAEMWWKIGRNLSAGLGWDLSSMENADDACAQLLAPRWDLDSQGRIRVELKDDIIKRIGRSPDNADALLLAFWSGLHPRMRVL
jgi:hypothetical protein